MVLSSFQRDSSLPSPRALFYLVIETSENLQGPPMQAINEGIELINKTLRGIPEAIEITYISVITFSSQAQVAVPLTPLSQFNPPPLESGGSANLAHALELVEESLNRDFRPGTPGASRGDYKPLILMLLASEPDNIHEARQIASRIINRPSSHRVGKFVAILAGPMITPQKADGLAKQIASMQDMSREKLSYFFGFEESDFIDIDIQSTNENPLDNLLPPDFKIEF